MTETINDPSVWCTSLPWPGPDTHKHQRGRLGVVSGSALNTGAARLAARAGLRIGAGLVHVFCPPDAASIVASSVEGIMVSEFLTPEGLGRLADPFDCVVIGPAAGLTEATGHNVSALSRKGAALVVDADALTFFRGREDQLFDCLDRDDVLTPHEGEFDRLFPGLLGEGRLAAARKAAVLAGCVIVLKGRETVLAAPDGRLRINRNGTPWLATAGSGDVLAGMVGGLIAQRMNSFDAASAAVWMHCDAARRFGPGLIAEDLPGLLPAVLSALWPG